MMNPDCLSQINKWYRLCLALLGLILALFAMTLGYNLRMRKDQVELAKENQAIKKELQEVERVNGKEKADIKQLQEKVKHLERKLPHHE